MAWEEIIAVAGKLWNKGRTYSGQCTCFRGPRRKRVMWEKRSNFLILAVIWPSPSRERTCLSWEAAVLTWQFWLQQHLRAPQFPGSPENLREEGWGLCHGHCHLFHEASHIYVPFWKARTLVGTQDDVDLGEQVKPFRMLVQVFSLQATFIMRPKVLLESLKWNCLQMASCPSGSLHLMAGGFGSSWSSSSALSLWA